MSPYRYTVSIERRINKEPVPDNLDYFLTEHQLKSISKLETQGWFLWFVRRPFGQASVPFLLELDFGSVAIIENDGTFNANHGFSFRWDLFY